MFNEFQYVQHVAKIAQEEKLFCAILLMLFRLLQMDRFKFGVSLDTEAQI